MTILLKAIVCSATFQQTFAKIHFLILWMFFLTKLPSLKAYKMFPGRLLSDLHEEIELHFS